MSGNRANLHHETIYNILINCVEQMKRSKYLLSLMADTDVAFDLLSLKIHIHIDIATVEQVTTEILARVLNA